MTDVEIAELEIAHEGTIYTNHPLDAGGPTKFGITRPILAQYRGVPLSRITPEHIRNLKREEAVQIYLTIFIRPFRMLPDSILRVNVIDMGVNAGQVTSIRLLQMMVGANVDGILGPQTIKLVNAHRWNVVFVGMRLSYYERVILAKPANLIWRPGWRNRALSFCDEHETQHLAYLRTWRVAHMRSARFGRTAKAYLLAV